MESGVNCFPGRGLGSLVKDFAQCWVGVDVMADLGSREFVRLGQGQLRKKFGDLRSNHVGAQDLPIFFIDQDLNPACVITQPEELGDALVSLLLDADARRHWSRRGIQRSRDFNLDRVVDAYEALFNDVIQHRRP